MHKRMSVILRSGLKVFEEGHAVYNIQQDIS